MTLKQMKHLLTQATPGKFKAEQDDEGHWDIPGIIGSEGFYNCDGTDEPNAKLLTALRNKAADLLELWEVTTYISTKPSEQSSEYYLNVKRLNAVLDRLNQDPVTTSKII